MQLYCRKTVCDSCRELHKRRANPFLICRNKTLDCMINFLLTDHGKPSEIPRALRMKQLDNTIQSQNTPSRRKRCRTARFPIRQLNCTSDVVIKNIDLACKGRELAEGQVRTVNAHWSRHSVMGPSMPRYVSKQNRALTSFL